jgi:hypothetical protein
MDLQPNRNVGLENQLQAIQLGASLYDRAQTQKRMMEQLQVQTAEQVMRQKQADLQNKIQSNAYAQALQEQEAQVSEFDAFQTFNNDVSNFLNSQEVGAKMPAMPRFKSKTFNQEAIKAISGLEQYSARAELIKQQAKTAAFTDQLEAKRIEDARKYGALTRTADGKYVIDDALIAKKRTEEEQLGKAAKISSVAGLASEDSIRALGLAPEIELQAIQTMRAKQAQKSPLTAALADWQQSAEDQKDAKFQILKAAAAKSGQDIIVGPSGEFEFKKALPQQVQTQLFNGIKSANTAIDLIESIKPSDVDKAFSVGGALRSVGQKIPLVPKFGGGLNPEQIRISQQLGSLTPLVARGLLSEQGRLTDADARRAEELIKTSYLTSSPEQVKQSLGELKSLFQNAKDRMKSPLGIIGEQEVLKIDTKQQEPGGQPQSQVQVTDVFSAMKQPPVFNSVEEAERAVPSGTKYKVGNKFYRKQ